MDLQSAAETAALAGALAIKQQLLFQAQDDPKKLADAAKVVVQAVARTTAVEVVSGKLGAAALVGPTSDYNNALTGENDLTVGFWKVSSQRYTPGPIQVNATQVRTRRTAESSLVGMGDLGSFLVRITGTESFGFTPVAIATVTASTRANVAICGAACDPSCSCPEVCAVEERRMTRAPGIPERTRPPPIATCYASLSHPVILTNAMIDMICGEIPAQKVCGRPILYLYRLGRRHLARYPGDGCRTRRSTAPTRSTIRAGNFWDGGLSFPLTIAPR